MRKFLAVFLAAALAFGSLPFLVSPTPAHASWDWCWDDPVISVNGQLVSIDIGAQGDPATLGAYVMVHVPRGAHASLVSNENAFPVRVSIVGDSSRGRRGGDEISVDVVVTSGRTRVPVQVVVSSNGHSETEAGTSNSRPVHVEFDLGD